jgi:glycosyltransferase involved in cell wall biosynthesis
MNVLHAIPGLSIHAGGPSRSVSELCAHLAEKVDNVSLVRKRGDDEEITLNSGIQDGYFIPENRTLILKETSTIFDICHSHAIWLPFSHEFTRYALENSIPFVVSSRGMLEPWALNHSKWKKKLAWVVYQNRDLQRATAFHATALSEAESIRRLGFKQPIAVIPNGVELPNLPEAVRRRSEVGLPWRSDAKTGGQLALAKRSVDLRSDKHVGKKTALFLSRINPKKGLPMLLDVWANIALKDWRLVIAGNDDSNHLTEVEGKIRQHGLQEVVEITGPLFGTDKEKAFRNADLFVLPSYSENFGIVVTEALAYEVPVLTTKGCPWQELETRNCGWWVDPTHEGIEMGLRQAFSTPDDELAAMGVRGRTLVEENYLWPAIAEKMMEFYEWILHEGTKPDFVV